MSSSNQKSNFGFDPVYLGIVEADDVQIEELVIDGDYDFGGDITIDNINATGDITALGALSSLTMNTGQGDYELFAMDQNVRTTDAVTFDTVNTGLGDFNLYAMDQNVRTTDAVTFLTIDTGQGANELYAMDQNLRTSDDVVFGTAQAGTLLANTSGDSDAIMSGSSGFRGVLFTRQTTAQREAIGGGAPTEGMLTYDTDIGTYYVYAASGWQPLENPSIRAWCRTTLNADINVTADTAITGYNSLNTNISNISLDYGTGVFSGLVIGKVYVVYINFDITFTSGTSGVFIVRFQTGAGANVSRRNNYCVWNSNTVDNCYFCRCLWPCNNSDQQSMRILADHQGTDFDIRQDNSIFYFVEM